MPRTPALPSPDTAPVDALPRLYVRGVEVKPVCYYTDDHGVTWVLVRALDGRPFDAQGSHLPYWFKSGTVTVEREEITAVYPQ